MHTPLYKVLDDGTVELAVHAQPGAGRTQITGRFGDALKVRVAGGVRFERSDQYAFGNDQVAFRAVVRCGAVTVDPNAVKFFQNSAT